jgi:hypothetical protein
MTQKKKSLENFALVEVGAVKISATTDNPRQLVDLVLEILEKKRKLGNDWEDSGLLNYIS